MSALTKQTLDKKTLRSQLLQKRQLLNVDVARDAALECVASLLALIPSTSKIVAGYSATRGELDIFPALTRLAGRGHQICLPIVSAPEKPLTFRHWQPGEALEKGVYNIGVPSHAAPKLLPDIVIVPLVAFDKHGHRLGYGAGYYDRTLQVLRRSKDVECIGVAYSMQEVDTLPADSYDEKLDAIVTEKGVMRFS